jgi:N-methylhydantoinase B
MQFLPGGGGGLGDPLLRNPDLVAADVRAGYITERHATAAYGVVLTPERGVAHAATEARRYAIRCERLAGAEPPLELRSPEEPGIAIQCRTSADGEVWACASCGTSLGPSSENWRDHGAILVEHAVESRLQEWDMQVRARHRPVVVLREYACTQCALALTIDVTLAGSSPVRAPSDDRRRPRRLEFGVDTNRSRDNVPSRLHCDNRL